MKKMVFVLVAFFSALALMGQVNIVSLEKMEIRLSAQVQYYSGNNISDASEFKFDGTQAILKKENETWQCDRLINKSGRDFSDLTYTFQLAGGTTEAAAEATMAGNQIKITNPTKFDARISVFIDKDVSKSYPQGFVSLCPKILIKAETTGYYTI